MKQNLFKSLFCIILLMIGINVWGDELTLTYENITATGYSAIETTFDANSVIFGYQNAMRNNSNGTPSGWAKDQVIQTKNGGSLYNTTSLGTISKIRVYIVSNTNFFSLKYGNSTSVNAGSIPRPTTATGTENVTYTSYADKTTTEGQTALASYYDFDLSGKDASYFSIVNGSSTIYIYKVVITYIASTTPTAVSPSLTSGCKFTTSSFDVTITNNESGSTVYYTIDGTDPTTSSENFTGESKTISISGTTIVKAMAVISGKTNSSVASVTYTYDAHKTPTLTYGACKKTMFTDDAADSFELTYDGDGELSVTSSAESIATVSISGNTVTVTPVAAGKTTITMSAAQTDNYYKTSRTYTLTVKGIAELPFSFDGQKGDITELAGIDYSDLGSNYTNSPKLCFNAKGSNVIVNYNSTAKYLYYTVKGNGFSDGQFDVLQSSDGVTYSTVKSYTAIDGTLAEYYSLNSGSRFVKFVYTTKSAGNVALGAIEISNNEPQTTVSVGSTGYATYYNSKHAYVMPEGCEGWVAYWNSKFVFEKAYSEGNIVPAGVALVLKNEGDYTLKYTNEAGTKPSKNYLSGTDEETELAANEKYYFYALSLDKEGNNVGFYWMNATGAAFTNGANKAYLTINKSNFPTEAKSGFAFNDATAINNVNAEVDFANSLIYNLAGQRVNSNAKGIVIKNGRKYINK